MEQNRNELENIKYFNEKKIEGVSPITKEKTKILNSQSDKDNDEFNKTNNKISDDNKEINKKEDMITNNFINKKEQIINETNNKEGNNINIYNNIDNNIKSNTFSYEKLFALKRIKQEFKDLNINPFVNIPITIGLPNEDNIFEWRCSMKGAQDSSYKGGLFYLKVPNKQYCHNQHNQKIE